MAGRRDTTRRRSKKTPGPFFDRKGKAGKSAREKNERGELQRETRGKINKGKVLGGKGS